MLPHLRCIVRTLVIFGMVYFLLLKSAPAGVIANIAIALLAVFITDFIVKIGWSSIRGPLLSDLKDKAVLITGCDSGFGNKLARHLDSTGVTVFAGCLFPEGSGATELKEVCSENLRILQLDVTKDGQVKAAVKAVAKVLKGKLFLQAVVNNAGVSSVGETEYTSIEEMKRVLEVNTFGVARVTHAFLPLLKKSRGRIVIVASVLGRVSIPLFVAYNMSKYAVLGYAETLRMEMLRWSVSVHIVEPWLYRTDMFNKDTLIKQMTREFKLAPDEIRKSYGGDTYLKKMQELLGFGLGIGQSPLKMYEVVNCLADACIGRYPALKYTPGLFGKVMTWITMKLPQVLSDLVFHLIITVYMRKGQQYKQD